MTEQPPTDPTPTAEADASHRLPGPLGRPRSGLPIAAGAPLIPTALTAFNRLTTGGVAEEGAAAELSGTPVDPMPGGRRRRLFGLRRWGTGSDPRAAGGR